MKHSTERILTTHAGSLPRPKDLLDLMKARAGGETVDANAYATRVRGAVADIVRQQVQSGVDVVTDGEQSKTSFSAYVNERLTGFEPKADTRRTNFVAEMEAFPEYYEQYFGQRMQGGRVVPVAPVVCTGPISYRGEEALRRDIENLKAAVAGVQSEEVFMPAVAPDGVGSNAYYRTEEEYLAAVADALHTEYQAIVDAGFLVQIDDPFLTELFSYSTTDLAERRKTAERYVEAINHGLRGIPPERVRYHTCYGINEGPRVYDAALKDTIDVLLKINAGAISFEAANPRHEHEYHVFENVKLPAGQDPHPRGDHARQQHRGAPGADRRAPRALRAARRARERHRRRRLRLLVPGDLQSGGPPDGRLGQVPGDGRRRAPGQRATVALTGASP